MLLGARQFFERRGAPTPPLPYDAEVEYLESTGTQWIDTLVNPLVSPTIHIGLELINGDDRDYFGNINYGGVDGSSLLIADFADYKLQYYRYASAYSVAATGVISTGTFHDVIVGKSVYVDGTLTYTSPNTYLHNAQQTNIMLFKSGRGNHASFRCSYFKLYDGETVVRDLIPVRFTNELGQSEGAMYDRVSGQLFRNAGTGAFTIGPDKTSWTNPYVTDGLVAMWDGEWNAGGGVHDASKRVVDLSGNSRDLTLSADCTMGDNYFALAPSSSESRIGGTVSIPELAGQSLLEFRIVARFTETTSWNKHCFYSSENTLYEFNYAHRNSTQIVPGVLINGNLAFVSNLSQYGGTVFALESQCRQVNYDGRNSYAAWLDNVYTTIGVTGSFRQSSDTSTDLHILKMATSNVDQTGYIYSFAIYNRYLTDAERAANYAIDKARFNLP